MLDLIAMTIGVLSFVFWTAACVAVGILNQRSRERKRGREQLARLLADAKRAAKAPEKVEPTQTAHPVFTIDGKPLTQTMKRALHRRYPA